MPLVCLELDPGDLVTSLYQFRLECKQQSRLADTMWPDDLPPASLQEALYELARLGSRGEPVRAPVRTDPAGGKWIDCMPTGVNHDASSTKAESVPIWKERSCV